MLTFEEKLAIAESFPELERKDVSLKRVNFHYPDSVFDKKVVIQHLHPNGNGFVFGGHLKNAETDERGFINIRDFSEDALRKIIKDSISSLSENSDAAKESAIIGEGEEQRWIGEDNQTLLLVYEDEWWNVYTGLNLEAAFGSYEEAEDYLMDEGFRRQV
ncbi:hypothetical protein LRR81_07265 [Metabacillus sp. GX 13764]|uniref:hypothetical protein n=1 Tax=Metabacillus kandeliae TaxID=2900151 RepID=UPI001E3C781B|nr:hypothetical protein [Metabacillus kandeliae]MCD7034033.1 hypothetical protein [Metabacillus kandeliae]